jgi:hypothetical protein
VARAITGRWVLARMRERRASTFMTRSAVTKLRER